MMVLINSENLLYENVINIHVWYLFLFTMSKMINIDFFNEAKQRRVRKHFRGSSEHFR